MMMKTKWVTYLKGKRLSSPLVIDSLFVSAFVLENGWNVERCSVIKDSLGYDEHIVREFIQVLKGDGFTFCIEDLMRLFEFVISPADRVVTGAVYTPKKVRGIIIRDCMEGRKGFANVRVADISCGCGSFLSDVALWIHKKTKKSYASIFRENIWGIDVQDYAIKRTKILLSLLAISQGEDVDFEFNLLCRDTLDYVEDWDMQYRDFDVIVGNPPYVCSRNLSPETHKKLKCYEVCDSGHPDLYLPFFQIAVEMLNEKGMMGYITMNTFLRSLNGRSVRKYFSEHNYDIKIVDFRGYQIFETRSTYTCLFYLQKNRKSTGIHYAVDDYGLLKERPDYVYVNYAELDNVKGWALNEYSKTVVTESIGRQIKDYCSLRHGIATLSNKTFIFNPVAQDEQYYYLDSYGTRYQIERQICRDVVNPNRLNSGVDINSLMQKVIFPYHIENDRALIYTPSEMMWYFPHAYAYLKDKKEALLKRDKGDTKSYPQWYAFGRTQSLIMPRCKLFFPKFANKPVRCAICDNSELLLYNGLAFVSDKLRKLKVLRAFIESEFFWDYVKANAKPYASGFYSLSGADIKHFGMPMLSMLEENELLAMEDREDIECWIRSRYSSEK